MICEHSIETLTPLSDLLTNCRTALALSDGPSGTYSICSLGYRPGGGYFSWLSPSHPSRSCHFSQMTGNPCFMLSNSTARASTAVASAAQPAISSITVGSAIEARARKKWVLASLALSAASVISFPLDWAICKSPQAQQ